MSDTEPVTVAQPDVKPASKAGKVDMVDASHYPRIVTRGTRTEDGRTYTTEVLQYNTEDEARGAVANHRDRELAVFDDVAQVDGGWNVEVQTDGTSPQ